MQPQLFRGRVYITRYFRRDKPESMITSNKFTHGTTGRPVHFQGTRWPGASKKFGRYGGRGTSRGVTGKPEICQELLAASHPIDEIPEKCPFRRETDSQSLLLSGFEQTARGRSQRGRADYCAWGVGLARGDPDDVGRRLSEEPAERRRHIIGANNLQSVAP
jgi:hypothetical protein